MTTLAALALTLLDRLLGLVEKRVNRPAKPQHNGVSDAQLDRLLKQASNKDLN